ncbi:MAG: hypothetical protein K0M64_06910 [Rhizobium sp.]|nr:hypothetical protein [Rhizobium sp.]
MLFLIEYDRLRGDIVSIATFSDDKREQVNDARLELELRMRSDAPGREVVVLDAVDEDALRLTHARYFKSAQALLPVAPGLPVAS